MSPDDVIAALRPRAKARIIDLVAHAGIDTTPWSLRKDGSAIETPASNPNFCYDWAFGGDGEPSMLCIWHRALRGSEGHVVYEDNLLALCRRLEAAAQDPEKASEVQRRAEVQAPRALRFDGCVRHAFERGTPLRLALLEGDEQLDQPAGFESSKAKRRALDLEPSYVHDYAERDGAFRMVRSERAPTGQALVDRFDVPSAPQKYVVNGNVYERSPGVRSAALRRANGVCECCQQIGFVCQDSGIYLETHHVVPLSAGGPDVVWNVVALCPTDHRRAHFAAHRDVMRSEFLQYLAKQYPSAASKLAEFEAVTPAHPFDGD